MSADTALPMPRLRLHTRRWVNFAVLMFLPISCITAPEPYYHIIRNPPPPIADEDGTELLATAVQESSVATPTATNQALPNLSEVEPDTPALPEYGGALEGHWILEVHSSGRYVTLEDGSLWKIDPGDDLDVWLWLPASEVLLVARPYRGYVFYDLVNLDDSEKARATYLGDVVIESAIEGDFDGWEGETVFVLGNGQVWQQASYDHHYEQAYSPEVRVYESMGAHWLLVEDVEDVIRVERLK